MRVTVTDANERLVREHTEAVAERDWDRFRRLITDDWVVHGSWDDDDADEFIEYMEGVRENHTKFEHHIDEIFSGSDHVAIRDTLTARIDGDYHGFEVSDPSFELPGMVIYRIENNKVAEQWRVANEKFVLDQLGVLPEKLASSE